MTDLYITRQEFETWIELNDVNMYKSPSYNSAAIRCGGKLTNDVEFTFTATAMESTNSGVFYGRHNAWNMIKVSYYQTENLNFHGKGARSPKTWKLGALLVSEMQPCRGQWDDYYGTIAQ